MIRITQFEKGLTVKELKEIITDWPEEDENGEPCEVWIGDNRGFSSPVCEVSSLNLRYVDNKKWADLLLSNTRTSDEAKPSPSCSELLNRAAVLKAVDDEPELNDEMPKEMADAILQAIKEKDVDLLVEAMQLTVRLTKKGIRDRIAAI